LQFQEQYRDDEEAGTGWEFQALELSFLALVVGGVLLAVPIVQSLSSTIGRIGIILSLFALLLLVFAAVVSIRRPRYPTEEHGSVEEAIRGRLRKWNSAIVAIIPTLDAIEFIATTLLFTLLAASLVSSAEQLLSTTAATALLISLAVRGFLDWYRRHSS
jgi:uncharacterized membrane protein